MAGGEVEGDRKLIKMGGTLSPSSKPWPVGRFRPLWGDLAGAFGVFPLPHVGLVLLQLNSMALLLRAARLIRISSWVRDAMTSFNRKGMFWGKRENIPHFSEVNKGRNQQSGVLCATSSTWDTIMFFIQAKKKQTVSYVHYFFWKESFEKENLEMSLLCCLSSVTEKV